MILSKPISIFNNRYLVYPDGKIYSNIRKKFLLATYNKTLKDYTYFLTIHDNVPKLFFAISIVYNSFHPGMYDRLKHRIVRIDGDKKNFKLENLKLMSKKEYFNFKATRLYRAGEIIYRNEIFRDIPGVNFHKISKAGKVLSYVQGRPKLCKARKAHDGSDLMTLTIDYRKQKSIYPVTVARKVYNDS